MDREVQLGNLWRVTCIREVTRTSYNTRYRRVQSTTTESVTLHVKYEWIARQIFSDRGTSIHHFIGTEWVDVTPTKRPV